METVWQKLKQAEKPIIMYGMGDGAEKIMKVMDSLGIKPAEFMASDEFVRGHSFLGYPVRKLSEIEEMYEDFIVVVCFGSNLSSVTSRLYELSEKYDLYAPDVPVVGEGIVDEKFISEQEADIKKVRKMLADEKSREVFDSLISYKLSGDINTLKSCETPAEEAEALLKIGKSETYVDLGAYNGDTVERFLRLTNKEFKEIYAVEPDHRNFTRMVRRNYALGRGIFHPINAAAWNENAPLKFRKSGGRNSSACNQYGRGVEVNVNGITVDKMLGGNKPTLIKIDVEGAEREALEGARESISAHRPRLILSVYHRADDFLTLPLLVRELNPAYKLYLRHHPYIPAWDTNLYCI